MITHCFTSYPTIRKAICLLTALIAVPSAALANTILTYQSTSPDAATGTLILGQPLTETQHPLAGSVFTVFGITFDLAPVFWNGALGTTLNGVTLDVATFTGVEMIPGAQPAQSFIFFDDLDDLGEGTGNWVVAPQTTNGVPDAGSSLAMLGLGLAGCAGLRRRRVGLIEWNVSGTERG